MKNSNKSEVLKLIESGHSIRSVAKSYEPHRNTLRKYLSESTLGQHCQKVKILLRFIIVNVFLKPLRDCNSIHEKITRVFENSIIILNKS